MRPGLTSRTAVSPLGELDSAVMSMGPGSKVDAMATDSPRQKIKWTLGGSDGGALTCGSSRERASAHCVRLVTSIVLPLLPVSLRSACW